ncbi:hypothetical protein MHBO_002908, partial [Bonamia ostreae]
LICRKLVKTAPGTHIVAMDCEMVLTNNGSELARCTVVDFEGNVVYDEFCKPDAPIVDYCTAFSGIDKKIMDKTSKRLGNVQNELAKVLTPATIICGHSLENDLLALRLVHEKVIDTSLLFAHPNGPPWKLALRVLAKKYLRRDIQQNELGHDSVEDARAVVDLIKLKFDKGYKFGNNPIDFESIFSLANRHGRDCSLVAGPMACKLFSNSLKQLSVYVCEDIENAVTSTEKILTKKEGFCWVSIDSFGKKDNRPASEMDEAIARIYEACKEHTLLIVLSGDLMNSGLKKMSKARAEWKSNNSSQWEKEETFENALKSAKQGIFLATMK